MLGLDPVTLSSLIVLAGYTPQCPDHAPAKINIIPRTEDVKYDYRQSLKKLQSYSTDTVDPYGFHGTTITQAFMKGQIQLSHKIQFGQAGNAKAGYGCTWYSDITVELHIDPTIVVAKEIYRDKCMRKAVVNHELKHVRVDREVVNKYAREMGGKLMEALKSRGFDAGPFKLERMNDVQRKMQRVVHQVLELEYKKLGIERQERQRAVDSLEEYESVDDECPAFEAKKGEFYRKWLK
ncbi:MAG: hypothetical protein ACRBDL_05150 [Alphaproteobacteria bacterium]